MNLKMDLKVLEIWSKRGDQRALSRNAWDKMKKEQQEGEVRWVPGSGH